jgi:hypothetical protein
MAASNNEFDTSFAKTVSQIMGTNLSLYSSIGHQILENINIESYAYGKQHITRPVADPFNDVVIDRRFAAPDQVMEKIVQDIDFVCISKRIVIDSVDYAADPQLVAKQVSDALNIVKDGIEKYFITGSTTRLIMYGIDDQGAGTGSTTINRMDEMTFTSDGDWSTLTNLQSDLAHAEQALIDKGFTGPFACILPASVQPLLAQVQTNTAIPANQWIRDALGLRLIFTPVLSVAAAWTFTCYIIDLSKVHLGMTDLKVDAFYSNKDHAYIWDFEVYMSALFDPLHDGTDYKKGVCSIDADWRD